EAQRPEVLPKSPMAQAIGYALNNWAALVRYTEAGFLAIDNNVSEREMKRIARGSVGCGNLDGGEAAGRDGLAEHLPVHVSRPARAATNAIHRTETLSLGSTPISVRTRPISLWLTMCAGTGGAST